MDQHGKVIYMNSFSKTLAPSLRIAYMVLPEGLMKEFETRFVVFDLSSAQSRTRNLGSVLAKGHFERHLNRMRLAYRSRRDQLIRALEASRIAAVATWSRRKRRTAFSLDDHQRHDRTRTCPSGETGRRTRLWIVGICFAQSLGRVADVRHRLFESNQ
ncbi:MAG: hypothetical protein MZU97_05040 [Bacillus subtilis]|nr:hypothetical protein [Bacillus subtilis]